MYAIVKTGGKQYRVEKGGILSIEKLEGDVGSEVSFDEVLLFSDGENVKVGSPALDGALVKGHIVRHTKGPKIIVFKFKRRKGFRNKKGHRQNYTSVMIDAIEA